MELGRAFKILDFRLGPFHVQSKKADVPIKLVKNINYILPPGEAEQDVVNVREGSPSVSQKGEQNQIKIMIKRYGG